MRRGLVLFALAMFGCSSSETETSGPIDTGSTTDSSRDTALTDTTIGDTTIEDSTSTDGGGGKDTSVADTSDTSVADSGTDTFPALDTGSDAALCKPADCAAPYECCLTPGKPFYGKCYNTACLACC